MRIFLDANVLVSVLNKEYPIFSFSSKVLSLCGHKNYQVFTSPICLAIAFYFAEKKSGSEVAKSKMALLSERIRISSVEQETVLEALKNKRVLDFEDGLEYYSAKKSKCECFVTEDVEDFHFADMEVLTCEAFLDKYFR